MNKNRRKRIQNICDQIEALREEFDAIIEEEQEAYDNMPEQLQDSEKGNAMYEGISSLEDISSSMESVQDEIMDYLES